MDPDISPAGLSETVALHKLPLFDGGASGASEAGSESPWEATLVGGQFIFADNNEASFGSDFKTDSYMFIEQLIATYKFNKDVSVTVAPGFLTFTASHLTSLRNALAFSDPADWAVNAPATQTQTQTTETRRDRTVVNYNASGKAVSGTLTPFTVTATQVQTIGNSVSTGRSAQRR